MLQRAGWIFALLVSFACLGAVSPRLTGTAYADDADARAVYCLAPAHRADLVAAAVTLGLAESAPNGDRLRVDGPARTPEQWRHRRPADFDRACDALIDAARLVTPDRPDSGWTAIWQVLLPVTAGALLTVLTSEWRGARDRGRDRAARLRTVCADFTRTARSYLDGWSETTVGGQPPDEPLRVCRTALFDRLRRTSIRHHRWLFAEQLATDLRTGPLGTHMTTGWTGLHEQSARATRAETVRTRLDRLTADVERVAHAEERPGRPHRDMRRPMSPDSRPAAAGPAVSTDPR